MSMQDVIGTVEYVAGTLGARREDDPDAKWLRDVADELRQGTDDMMCCPLCEEVVCDSSCPVGPYRL